VQVIGAHGLRSQAFADAFDQQETLCALDPAVTVDWPSHLLWARHRMLIASTEDVEIWLSRAGTEALLQHGLRQDEVLGNQSKLLADKLAVCIKSPSLSATKEAMRSFFHKGREWPFHADLIETTTALVILSTYEDIASLEEIIELCSEADDVLSTDSKNKNPVGTALFGWPRGDQLLKEMRLFATRARATLAYNTDTTTTLQGISSDLAKLSGGPAGLLGSLVALPQVAASVRNLADRRSNDASDVLALFVLSPDALVLQGPIAELICLLQQTLVQALAESLRGMATIGNVCAWVENQQIAVDMQNLRETWKELENLYGACYGKAADPDDKGWKVC
jgi:hypothetical protein